MMKEQDFRPDCANCAGLCCVAFAFDRSDDFGHDKPADKPCRHLDAAYRCTIHDDLADKGYPGCVRFDCLGAGQRVTKELFDGGDWQADPTLLEPMASAFRAMRRVHELLQLLLTARRLAVGTNHELERQRLLSALDPDTGWTAAGLVTFERGPLADEVGAFLRSLADGPEKP